MLPLSRERSTLRILWEALSVLSSKQGPESSVCSGNVPVCRRAAPPGGHCAESACHSSLHLCEQVEGPRAPDLDEGFRSSAQSASSAWVSETQSLIGPWGPGQPPGLDPLFLSSLSIF